jgi:D-proline reductase (dithiol) PrdB
MSRRVPSSSGQKNRFLARLVTRFPLLAKIYVASYRPLESDVIPWTPVVKPLRQSKVAIITTAGVHRKDQAPFNMQDRNGDPSFREIDGRRPAGDLMITHDYYNHTDADRDINIVFPIERLEEFEKEGIIGQLAGTNYGFMGHILGTHIDTLKRKSSPEAAGRLKAAGVDAVLLTPG